MSSNPVEDEMIKQVDEKAEADRIAEWEKKYGVTVHAVKAVPFWWGLGAVVALVAVWLLMRGEAGTLSDIENLLRPFRR